MSPITRRPGASPFAARARRRLCLFFAASVVCVPARAFDYFEHRYLGSRAYENALAATHGLPKALATATRDLGLGKAPSKPDADLARRALASLPLQFGDLSALAADFTKDPKDLRMLLRDIRNKVAADPGPYDAVSAVRAKALVISSRQHWFRACEWNYRANRGAQPGGAVDLENCFKDTGDEGFRKPPKSTFGTEGYAALREELAALEKVPEYVSLASANRTHFARYSWKSYRDRHSQALALARCYGEGRECRGADGSALSGDGLLADMLLYEAFAQHYLHDSFASGHLGTKYSSCAIEALGLFCTPTKLRMQQTHNWLDRLGLDVRLPDPPDALGLSPEVTRIVHEGWTAFGDDHLFTPEADFHRALLVHVATRSMQEVFEEAGGAPRASPPGTRIEPDDASQPDCGMCTTGIFPVPVDGSLLSEASLGSSGSMTPGYAAGSLVEFESVPFTFGLDARSRDPRIPGIPLEGWKLLFGYARQTRGRVEGQEAPVSDTGVTIGVEYLRSAAPIVPNAFGFEYWNVHERGTSYLFTGGYLWPREVTAVSLSVKAKLGWRTEEIFTENNPSSERRTSIELSLPAVELSYNIYPPFALVLQTTLGHFSFYRGKREWETVGQGKYDAFLGLRLDVSGI